MTSKSTLTLKNTAERWGPVSQLLHWTIVLLIARPGPVGLLHDRNAQQPRQDPGLCAAQVARPDHAGTGRRCAWLWRVVRRHAATRWPARRTGRSASPSLTHWALYALLFAIPLSGWVLNSAAGFPLQWFGLFNLPRDHRQGPRPARTRRGAARTAVLAAGCAGAGARRRRVLPPPVPARRHAGAHAAASLAACRCRHRSENRDVA